MEIINYKILISNLPVCQQCFMTKRTTWLKAEKEINWLRQLNNNIFGDHQTLTISRQDIFQGTDLRETLIKAIYWGYPRGMRGNNFVDILKNIDQIENSIKELKQTDNPTTYEFNKLTDSYKKIKGLGLSTYSKLLYFSQLSFNNNPCLILDQRLIDVFASKTYFEFQQLSSIRYENAESKYLNYIQMINLVSQELNTKGENIEQFLFIFGNNLK